MRCSRTRTNGVACGSMRKHTRRMMPVSPIPPIVAANSSGSVVGRDAARLAVGGQQVEPLHMVAEAAVAVVVLAVDVGGDGAADGGEGGARAGRRHEAARHERLQQVAEGNARLATSSPVGRLEGQQPVEPLGQQRVAAAVERRVAIGAAGAARDQAFGPGFFEGRGDLALALGPAHAARRGR